MEKKYLMGRRAGPQDVGTTASPRAAKWRANCHSNSITFPGVTPFRSVANGHATRSRIAVFGRRQRPALGGGRNRISTHWPSAAAIR